MRRVFTWIGWSMLLAGCMQQQKQEQETTFIDVENEDMITINREKYKDQLQGFWLGQCIANWTGLITEMDKIGGEGIDGIGAGFYTRADWGQPDQPNIWNSNLVSDTIDFYFVDQDGIWGADDDTDIEYMYQYLLYQHNTSLLTASEIREGWLTHIYSDENTPFRNENGEPENYLWVSNQRAHDLMKAGLLPPATGDSVNNPHYEMIDAQLTTEIFGLYAPGRCDIALQLARLPIQTTARGNAECIAQFYVSMYALASVDMPGMDRKARLTQMAERSKFTLPEGSYALDMYEFVKAKYLARVSWEEARDALHERYQVQQTAGYSWATRDEACNGCFAAGINFGASLISLFYGEGDLKETIKIGVLAGWDSDNPTATWGGLLGFMLGKSGVEETFGRKFSNRFNIHRTRGGFPHDGINTFEHMAEVGTKIVDRALN
ncbi:ADP-ribosylglycohydrolase family protein [Reichenbachiella sp.]|uniref:ADP-ribosylglycohydrolase family protein n=1 Tax=Reichenbachiella sp. TaxID=2184521 RepID=UPI003B5935BF